MAIAERKFIRKNIYPNRKFAFGPDKKSLKVWIYYVLFHFFQNFEQELPRSVKRRNAQFFSRSMYVKDVGTE